VYAPVLGYTFAVAALSGCYRLRYLFLTFACVRRYHTRSWLFPRTRLPLYILPPRSLGYHTPAFLHHRYTLDSPLLRSGRYRFWIMITHTFPLLLPVHPFVGRSVRGYGLHGYRTLPFTALDYRYVRYTVRPFTAMAVLNVRCRAAVDTAPRLPACVYHTVALFGFCSYTYTLVYVLTVYAVAERGTGYRVAHTFCLLYRTVCYERLRLPVLLHVTATHLPTCVTCYVCRLRLQRSRRGCRGLLR